MKVTTNMIVLNEADYIYYALKSSYPIADKIIIVEGAVENAVHGDNTTPEGHSTDGTMEIIESFPDPDRKILVFQKNRPWKNKIEMKQKALQLTPWDTDYILYQDGDEIYHTSELAFLRKYLEAHPEPVLVCTHELHFWHDFYHYCVTSGPSPWNQAVHATFIKNFEGLNFNQHHCKACDGKGRFLSRNPFYAGKVIRLPKIIMFHYGEAKSPQRMLGKFRFQKKRGRGEVKGSPEDEGWFTGIMPKGYHIIWFDGMVPEVLRSHPLYGKEKIKVVQQEPVCTFKMI